MAKGENDGHLQWTLQISCRCSGLPCTRHSAIPKVLQLLTTSEARHGIQSQTYSSFCVLFFSEWRQSASEEHGSIMYRNMKLWFFPLHASLNYSFENRSPLLNENFSVWFKPSLMTLSGLRVLHHSSLSEVGIMWVMSTPWPLTLMLSWDSLSTTALSTFTEAHAGFKPKHKSIPVDCRSLPESGNFVSTINEHYLGYNLIAQSWETGGRHCSLTTKSIAKLCFICVLHSLRMMGLIHKSFNARCDSGLNLSPRCTYTMMRYVIMNCVYGHCSTECCISWTG